MTQYKVTPKYLLLTAPTLKGSRTFHLSSLNLKNRQTCDSNQLEKLNETDQQKTSIRKSDVFTKQIDEVRQQLALCIQANLSESKRNNVLKQLNSILQLSNLQIEEKSKNEWKERIQNDKRRCEKEEAEIEQILQKYNEEVARINALREMANSARTDRVVYSALFKKIQWEIKHYQNLYRETIIKTQTNKISKGQKQPSVQQILQSADQLQNKDQFGRTYFKYDDPTKSQLFMTELQKHIEPRPSKKPNSRRSYQTLLKLTELTEQIQSKIERIIKTAQCQNAEDTIQWYTSIQSQNENLLKLIEEEQFKIEEIENQIMRMVQVRRNSEVSEQKHVRKLQTLSSTRKLRTLRHIKTSVGFEEESMSNFVRRLAKVAGISVTKDRLLTDVVVELEQRLSRQDLVNNELRSGSNLQSGVDNILSKMERFDSCDRILSKRQFEGEYMRELSKQKKSQRIRKLSKK